ncbi:MAG: type II CRISPR-associated endonuclease Cas1 [Mycoplasma sp.]|nr:type II CRISPR-associated endonuclease Cas1 [Mycoplasma sp.]
MGWRIIEINSDDYLKLYLNNLLIKRDDKKIIINLNDIDVLLLDNYKTILSVQLINALTRHNIIIIIFDVKHEPSSYIFNVKGNHKSLKVLANQISWTQNYKNNLWKEIVKNKIYNQKQHIFHAVDYTMDLSFFDKLTEQVQNFDLSNREGHAAKVYWHLLFGINFIRDYDAKEFPIINSMLNYGYTILRGMVIKSIIKKGLDPRISLFHKSFTNFYALASDLMEPFRIIIDQEVYKNRNTEAFTIEIRNNLVKCLTKKVYFDHKYEYINNAIDKAIDQIINNKGWKWIYIWK